MSEANKKRPVICPVCGKYTFDNPGEYDTCPVCGWEDDVIQRLNPDEDCCANQMSLNQAREAYKKGLPIR